MSAGGSDNPPGPQIRDLGLAVAQIAEHRVVVLAQLRRDVAVGDHVGIVGGFEQRVDRPTPTATTSTCGTTSTTTPASSERGLSRTRIYRRSAGFRS